MKRLCLGDTRHSAGSTSSTTISVNGISRRGDGASSA
jgi:hypothetical protein